MNDSRNSQYVSAYTCDVAKLPLECGQHSRLLLFCRNSQSKVGFYYYMVRLINLNFLQYLLKYLLHRFIDFPYVNLIFKYCNFWYVSALASFYTLGPTPTVLNCQSLGAYISGTKRLKNLKICRHAVGTLIFLFDVFLTPYLDLMKLQEPP